MTPNKRSNVFYATKHQREILSYAFIPSFLICLFTILLFKMFYDDLTSVILTNGPAPSIDFINRWGIFIIVALWGFFAAMVMWVYYRSKFMVGAFERLIREMDEIIAGKAAKPLKARKHDDLANELTKRVNFFLEAYAKKK